MAHARTQVRNALLAQLTGLPTTGSRVGFSVYPEPELPALRVFSGPEGVPEARQSMGQRYFRQLTLLIEVRVEAVSALIQGALDDICVEVESAVEADDTLGGLVKCLVYQGTVPGYEDGGSLPVGIAVLTYQAEYTTTAADPETIVD